MADRHAAEAYDDPEPTPVDETAQRLLNLLFVLNAAPRPLTTEELVSDSDLGYGSGNRASDLRKFRRDREKLEERGVYIAELKTPGSSETEQSAWALDRARTFAAGGLVREEDARLLVAAIDAHLAVPGSPFEPPLRAIRTKALESLEAVEGELSVEDGATRRDCTARDAITDALWTAFSLRRTIKMRYTDAAGKQSERVIAVYGIFSHESAGYIAALDDASGEVRTFRIDRIARLGALGSPYEIPDGFDARAYLFLPFDLASGPTATAVFTLPAERTEAEVQAITYGRGRAQREADGTWSWTVEARDVNAAAAFALSHAHDGMRPQGPAPLVDAWRAHIERTVAAHAS